MWSDSTHSARVRFIMQSTMTRQSQDHQGRLRVVTRVARRALETRTCLQLSRQNKRRHTTRCSSTAAAQALALSARGLPALAHVFAEAQSWSPCCRRHHSRMMPGRRSSSQLAPSKLIAPSSPPCTAPPLALPVWPAWTASREREGGAKRLKASDLAVPYQTPQRKAPFDLPACGIETT